MKTLFFALSAAACLSAVAWGDAIPYPNAGTIAPTVPLVAASTGEVTGYFFGFSAAADDLVQMCDVTQSTCSALLLDNQSTAVGASADFGPVMLGDVLFFNLINNSTGKTLSSDPAFSDDGVNHAYVTTYSGSGGPAGIPAGMFIGMEDLVVPGSDLDYNDDQFVFTNVSMTMAPEPSLIILCMAVLAMVPVARKYVR
jgi:hypothetical protein